MDKTDTPSLYFWTRVESSIKINEESVGGKFRWNEREVKVEQLHRQEGRILVVVKAVMGAGEVQG